MLKAIYFLATLLWMLDRVKVETSLTQEKADWEDRTALPIIPYPTSGVKAPVITWKLDSIRLT